VHLPTLEVPWNRLCPHSKSPINRRSGRFAETRTSDRLRARERSNLVPLLPLDDVHFLSTLCFDLYAHGVRWATIAERYRLPSSITKDICIEFVEQHGRKIYQFRDDPAFPRHEYQILSGIPLPDLPRFQETPMDYHLRTGYPFDLCRRYLLP